MFLFYFGNIPTVWYFLKKYFVYFSFHHGIYLISGLDCLHCTNVAIGSSVSSVVRGAFNRIISPLTTPECADAQSVTDATGVTLERCTAVPQTGQVNKCGALIGTLTVPVSIYVKTIGNLVCSFYEYSKFFADIHVCKSLTEEWFILFWVVMLLTIVC